MGLLLNVILVAVLMNDIVFANNEGKTFFSFPHPLDPLTDTEIRTTTQTIKIHRPTIDWVFLSIILQEPPKSTILEYFLQNREIPRRSGIPRKSISIIRDRNSPTPNQVVVNLSTRRVESWSTDQGQTGIFTEEETFYAERITKEDSQVQKRCRQQGYPNMSLIEATSWSLGYIGDRPEYQGRRLVQMFMFGKNYEKDNANAHPFDFAPIVDLIEGKVVGFEELPAQSDIYDDGTNKEGVTVPTNEHNYDPSLKGPSYYRSDLRPVRSCQEGTSYSFTKNVLQWQKFKLRLGFNGREGLILYWISYNDDSTVRPLFYRMSISEMVVPYGDPRSPYHQKSEFDEGLYGLGYSANSLRPQEDCIGNVAFMDVWLHTELGDPRLMEKVVCIREEDVGVGWKKTNPRTKQPYLTRRQRLALSFVATIGHYDYNFSFHFYQDATIEFNVKMTGIMSVNLLAVNATSAGGHGTIIGPQLNAMFHQHYFVLRADPEIDGNKNTMVMADVVRAEGTTGSRENRYGNAFRVNRTVFNTAGESRTNVDMRVRRTWVATNIWPIDPKEQTVGWKLWPHASPGLMLQDDAALVESAAGFLKYNTWVTPYKDDQFYAGGVYVGGKDGLNDWVEKDPGAGIANTDIVLWHILDAVHIPRQEDWPVMPVEECNVRFEPFNFFKENPALDVPQVQRENPYRQL